MPFDFVRTHLNQITKGTSSIFGFDLMDFLPRVGTSFCDAQSRNPLQSFFAPQVEKHSGARRILAQVIEGIDQCIADKAAQESSVAEFLRKY